MFNELVTQAVTYSKELKLGTDTRKHWTWPPRYVGIPKPTWRASVNENAKRDAIKVKFRIRSKKRAAEVEELQNRTAAERADNGTKGN